MDRRACLRSLVALAMLSMAVGPAAAQEQPPRVTARWDKVTRTSQTTATLQVVVNPPLRRGSPIHDKAFQALRDLQADYVRYVPWQPYPRLAVAALEPPRDGRTSWDFSLIDPVTIDFLEATKGHPAVLERVDQTTAFEPPASSRLGDETVTLGGLAVAVVTLP